ncbi:MAG: hypothetical protein ICV64_10585 [Thermoleophilia bacterium]|nr:hypothetical protein [Thermoleophilia bacterium]
MPRGSRIAVLAVAAAGGLAVLSLASGAGGDLDTSFGEGGKVVTALGASAIATSLGIQPDGNIVVAGNVSGAGPVLVRYRPDGRLDRDFGNGGSVSTVGLRLAVQRDGAIVVAGVVAGDVTVARHRPDGSLDRTFGNGGIVRTDLGGAESPVPGGSVLVRPDGRLVVVTSSGRDGVSRLALARYRRDGSLDPSFGSGGRVVAVDAGAVAGSLAPGGKLVVLGLRTRETAQGTCCVLDRLVLARFTSRGTLDRSFAGDGIATADAPRDGAAAPRAVAVQRDGKIVVAAEGIEGNVYGLLRYRANGSLDRGFGKSVMRHVGDFPVYATRAIALDARDRIVLAGSGPDTFDAFAVARVTRAGRLDERFGGGVVTTYFGRAADAFAAAVQRDGMVVAAGWQSATERRLGAPDSTFALARYLPSTCHVPRVVGKSLRAAARAVRRRNCVLTASRAFSRRVPRGRVIRQRPSAARVVPDHRSVAVLVSRGPRR